MLLKNKSIEMIVHISITSQFQIWKNETLLVYTSPKNALLRELTRAKCSLPDDAKGYNMLRDEMALGLTWVFGPWTPNHAAQSKRHPLLQIHGGRVAKCRKRNPRQTNGAKP